LQISLTIIEKNCRIRDSAAETIFMPQLKFNIIHLSAEKILRKVNKYFNVVSSIWAAMERQNKPPPRGHWRQGRGLDGEIERSDWWRG